MSPSFDELHCPPIVHMNHMEPIYQGLPFLLHHEGSKNRQKMLALSSQGWNPLPGACLDPKEQQSSTRNTTITKNNHHCNHCMLSTRGNLYRLPEGPESFWGVQSGVEFAFQSICEHYMCSGRNMAAHYKLS